MLTPGNPPPGNPPQRPTNPPGQGNAPAQGPTLSPGDDDAVTKMKYQAQRAKEREDWEKREYFREYYKNRILHIASDYSLFVPLNPDEKPTHSANPNRMGNGAIVSGADDPAFPKHGYYKVETGKDKAGNPIYSKEFDILYDDNGVRPADSDLHHGTFNEAGWSKALDFAASELGYKSIKLHVSDRPEYPDDAKRYLQAMIKLCAEKGLAVDVKALEKLPFVESMNAGERHKLIEAARATRSSQEYNNLMTGVYDTNSLQKYQTKLNVQGQGRLRDKDSLLVGTDVDASLKAIDTQRQEIETRMSKTTDIHDRLYEGVQAEKKLIENPDAKIQADKLATKSKVSAARSTFAEANANFNAITAPTDQDRKNRINDLNTLANKSAEQRGLTYNAMERELANLDRGIKAMKSALEKVKPQDNPNATPEQKQKITAKIKALEEQIDVHETDLTQKTNKLQEMKDWNDPNKEESRADKIKQKEKQLDRNEQASRPQRT